ncbi:hypothetical protein KCU71_g1063, partial [Aureobasidium melanogenum]
CDSPRDYQPRSSNHSDRNENEYDQSRYAPPQPPRHSSRQDGLIERYEDRGRGNKQRQSANRAAVIENQKTATAHAGYIKQKSNHIESSAAKSGKRVIVALRSSGVISQDVVDKQSDEGLSILKCCASRVLGTCNYNATVAYRNGERSSNAISDGNELWDGIKPVPDSSELTIFVISLVGSTTNMQQLK